jgi:hypothetical protein
MPSSDYPDTTSTDPETTIRRSLWRYPSLFANRADVLYHLFCIIGNGYDWVNGELVGIDHGMPWEDRPISKPDDSPLMAEIHAELQAEEDAKRARNRGDIERWAADTGSLTRFESGSGGPGWRPTAHDISQYQYLWAVPDDVTDEWRRVWQEARDLFIPMYRDLLTPREIEQARTSWENFRSYRGTGIDVTLPFPFTDPTCPHCGKTARPSWSHETYTCRACLPAATVSLCQSEQHNDTVHGGPPHHPDIVRAWLAGQRRDPLVVALRAALDRIAADGLFDWGPKTGSYAEGAYDRAHSIFYGIEAALHDAISTTEED